jgi:hypothetical protein
MKATAYSLAAAAISLTPLAAQLPEPATTPAGPRIVNCDDNTPSPKRGVCANKLSEADFRALAPGVSWYYSWNYEETSHPPADAKIEFIPMAWSVDQARLTGLKNYLAAGHHPRVVLALNEPNLKGQCFVTPEVAAAGYAKIKEVADEFHIPTVGPHMAIGSSNNDSIQAMDPIQNKMVTYTFMTPYLKAFYHFAEANHTQVGDLGVHSYGNIGELKWVVEMAYKEFGHPVWVTEYAWWGAHNPDEARNYLIEATNFLESNPHVAGYAWFKERADKSQITLLEKQSGVLSPLGKAYVGLPVHDPNVFFRIPGKLAATRYATAKSFTLTDTKDPNALLQVEAEEEGATLDYNLAPAFAGSYHLKAHVLGHAGGKIDFTKGAQSLASATLAKDGWQDIDVALPLTAGMQTIELKTPFIAITTMDFTQ